MSEIITPNSNSEETIEVINNEVTKRLRSAYIAEGFTTYDQGLLLVEGKKKDGATADFLVTFDGWLEVAHALREAIEASKKAQKEAEEPSNIITPDFIKP